MSYDPRCSDCLKKAVNGDQSGCGDRHWVLRVYPFDDMIQAAPTLAKARWRNYRAAREAGYFNGGAAEYFANLGPCHEVSND